MNLRKWANKQIAKIEESPARGYLRRWWLDWHGIHGANPYFYSYMNYPAWRLQLIIDDIIFKHAKAYQSSFAVEIGCGTGTHYGDMLHRYAVTLDGVDVFDVLPRYHNSYWKVPVDKCENILGDEPNPMPDNHVDLVFAICLSDNGIAGYSDFNSRAGRYCRASNVPRILKLGGLFIIIEWNKYTEFQTEFKVPDIPLMRNVDKGFKEYCPYAVYLKDKSIGSEKT